MSGTEGDSFAREKLEIDRARLDLEKRRLEFDQRFWHRNFGTMATFAVAFLGLFLSAGQVWVAYLQKDREAVQRANEITDTQSLKERELVAQEKRDLRTFVSQNQDKIFSPDQSIQDKTIKLMLTTFTAELVKPIIDNLFEISTPARQTALAQARKDVAELVKPRVYIQYQDANDASLVDGIRMVLDKAGYRAPGKELVTQQTKGDVRYFHTDEKTQAEEISKLVREYLTSQGRETEMPPLFAGLSFPNVARGQFEVWIPARPKP